MVPQIDPEHPQMISQGPSVCVFNTADPQEVLASWLFAQYLLTNDVQERFRVEKVPTVITVVDKKILVQEIPADSIKVKQ